MSMTSDYYRCGVRNFVLDTLDAMGDTIKLEYDVEGIVEDIAETNDRDYETMGARSFHELMDRHPWTDIR